MQRALLVFAVLSTCAGGTGLARADGGGARASLRAAVVRTLHAYQAETRFRADRVIRVRYTPTATGAVQADVGLYAHKNVPGEGRVRLLTGRFVAERGAGGAFTAQPAPGQSKTVFAIDEAGREAIVDAKTEGFLERLKARGLLPRRP